MAKKKTLQYFFFHGDLHQKLHISRANDIITAWNYPKGVAKKYIYSDVLRNGGKAFFTKEVCKMLRRGRTTVEMAIVEGKIPAPQKIYGIDEHRRTHAYLWSEEDVLNAHSYFATVHIGRPRKDGLITTGSLPTRRELRALMHQRVVLYDQDGNYVPTFDAI